MIERGMVRVSQIGAEQAKETGGIVIGFARSTHPKHNEREAISAVIAATFARSGIVVA